MLTKAFGSLAAHQPLASLDIANSGVCLSDLHQMRGEWAGTIYRFVIDMASLEN